LRSGTPVGTLRKSLGPQRTVLDEMVAGNLVRVFEDQYLPTFRGIEQFDDDVRAIVRHNLNRVLRALQQLYRASEQNVFGFLRVLEETKQVDPTLDANDVLPALVLGDQICGYYSLNGLSQNEDRLSAESATVVVAEKILDFGSIEHDWTEMMAKEVAAGLSRLEGGIRVIKSNRASQLQPSDSRNLDLGFIRRGDLKKIAERDYAELQRVKAVAAAKSRCVLCGGLIEALLLDALSADEEKAKAASRSPKLKGGSQSKPLPDWNLAQLIDVALELRIVGTDAEQFSHGVRNYRNLIHPGKELRSEQRVADEESDIAEKVLEIIARELRPKKPTRP